jgi:hypothetical protein
VEPAGDEALARSVASEPGSEGGDLPPRRRWVRWALLGMLAGAILTALVPLGVVSPYLRDDYVLEGVVRAVALDWRDFGREEAEARLEYELDHQGIGLWVGDDDCRLEVAGAVRRVTCAWRAEVRVPLADVIVPLAFRSTAGVDGAGALVP